MFINGDQSSANSVKILGEFYKIDALLLGIGILCMIIKPRKEWFIIAAWAALAPIPGALSGMTPHAVRGIFMIGSEQLIAAYGLYRLANLFKK